MKIHKIKINTKTKKYSLFIGPKLIYNIDKILSSQKLSFSKILIVIDKNIPSKFKSNLIKNIKSSVKKTYIFNANERNKNQKNVDLIQKILFKNRFNRDDCLIAFGGGITGDVVGYCASTYKRGIKFINIPTTLLAQVDSSIGGKTGINNSYGKNLVGSFYQPKLVLSNTSFIDSLPKKEMICGYAEILKHAIIKDKNFFYWLKKNTKSILSKKSNQLIYAIKKSCEIKMYFVEKDVNEKNMRMVLNFGHTFAHAIEVKNNYSSKITHGEAVLSGMILATRLSVIKKICSLNVLKQILNIYLQNNLTYTIKKYSKQIEINKLIPYLKNDKKNNDDKINFILLRNIGQTALPDKSKISLKNLRKLSKAISQY